MRKPQILSSSPVASAPARVIAAIGTLVTGYYRLAVPFFFLLLCLFYLLWSYYWTRLSCRNTEAKGIELPLGLFAGEYMVRRLEFSNKGFLPLVRCGIHFFLPEHFSFVSNAAVVDDRAVSDSDSALLMGAMPFAGKGCTVTYAWITEKNAVSFELEMKAGLRGCYYFPPAYFFVGDPSGLFRSINELGTEQLLYVYPRLKTRDEIMKILALADNHREDVFGLEDLYQVQGIKDYQVSDPLKSINWYATARTGSLLTNLYQRQDSEYCLVVLDLSVANLPEYELNYERKEDALLEETISLAAGIALYHLEKGTRTAFYTNAPLIRWEKKQEKVRPGAVNAYMKKLKGVTALDFAGEESGQDEKILKLCAAIDDTARASRKEQARLWAKVEQAPANSLVYVIGFHRQPDYWHVNHSDANMSSYDPVSFYSPERLAGLRTSRVRLINLAEGGDEA